MSSPVQATTASNQGVSSQSISLTSVTAGNCLILLISYADVSQLSAATPAVPTDSNGTVSTAINPTSQINAGNLSAAGVEIFYVQNCNAGTHSFTINPFSHAAALYIESSLTEWNVLTATPIDKSTSNGSNSAASTTTGNTGTTATLSQASELEVSVVNLLSATGLANAGISDPPATWTKIYAAQNTSTSVGAQASYKEAGVTTGQITTWTWNSDATQLTWQAAIATFMETASTVNSIFPTSRSQHFYI